MNRKSKGRPSTPLAERFWKHVSKTATCWLWTGSLDAKGYGRIRPDGSRRFKRAHRIAYEFLKGPIPEELELDHLCRNHRCVNPDHLEPVTHRENTLRGNAPGCVTRRTGVCKRGHSISGTNVYTHKGKKSCRACRNLAWRNFYQKRRLARNG